MNRFLATQKQTWNGLRKKSGFIAMVVSTMGITLGALLCVFTLAYVLLLSPLPYPQQDRLYQVNSHLLDSEGQEAFVAYSYPELEHLYNKQRSFSELAMLTYAKDVLTSHPAQPTLDLGYTTPEFFSMLGVSMALGQTFDASHGLDSHNPVAIISYQTWQQVFGGDEDILTKTIYFTGVGFRIIGVLSPSFIEPQLNQTGINTQVWLPWDYNLSTWAKEHWTFLIPELLLVGKKLEGPSVLEAEETATSILREPWENYTGGHQHFKGTSIKIQMRSLRDALLGDIGDTLTLLLAGVIGMVLIATANVSNLFMSRTAEQQRTLAIRAAVGATPANLFRTLLAESGQLMCMVILLALPLSALGFAVLQQFLAGIFPRVEELAVGPFTVLLAVAVVVVFALAFATLGQRLINYRALNQTLQSSGKGTGIQVSQRIRIALIFSQVAIATMLIFVNGLLFDNAVKVISQPMGFEVENRYRLNLSYSAKQWPSESELIPIMSQIRAKLQQLPQVDAVTGSNTPFGRFGQVSMKDPATEKDQYFALKQVSGEYFQMMQQPMLEGNTFSEDDQRQHNNVLVINDVFAKNLVSDGSAIGHTLVTEDGVVFRVIGVVKGIQLPGEGSVEPRGYRPESLGLGSAIIKVKDKQHIEHESVVSILKSVDGMFTVGRLERLTDLRNQKLFPQYMAATTTAILAILSLFIAAIGLYGILSYAIQMRKTEFGTRMAVGADKAALVKLVLKDNALPVGGGIIFSSVLMIVVYFSQKQLLEPHLNGNMGFTFILTVMAILLTTFVACYMPLRQYVNRQVIHALRD